MAARGTRPILPIIGKNESEKKLLRKLTDKVKNPLCESDKKMIEKRKKLSLSRA